MSEESQLIGYCLKCKEKRPITEPVAEWAANGTPATRGKCPVCEGNIYRRGLTAAHDGLAKPDIVSAPTKRKPAKRKKIRSRKKPAPRRSGKLVVVESPAKARTIGRYLGRGYTVKSSVGHVRDLLRSRLSVDVENEFAPEYRVPNDKRKTVKELKAAAAKAKEIFLATDPDREGEAIAWHVQESAEMDPDRTKRVVFNEITKGAVQDAFSSPRAIDMNRVDAQQARRILDRLVGYKLSPLLWRKIRGRLSAGRVQSVAVRLVVEREREINEFQEVEYWTLKANLSRLSDVHQKPRPTFRANLSRLDGSKPKLESESQVSPHLGRLRNADWQVGEVKVGTRSRRPAAPFTTSTLQQEASRRLKFGTGKTMRVAQQLYEGVEFGDQGLVGLITYMRTDSVAVSKDAQAQAREYVQAQLGPAYLPKKSPVYKTKAKAAQEAHEAVRPTSVQRLPKLMRPYLKNDQYRLYNLIWDRFVASQMAPARYDTVAADVWAGDKELQATKRPYRFRASGSSLSFKGFLALYEETKPTDRPKHAENPVPANLNEGETLDLIELLPEQHFTQPPPRYSEATLVKGLEEHGIGRPSTYAAIISTIRKRGYVDLDKRRLRPTETGQVVNDLLVKHFPDVLSVDFTARMESELDKIADGSPWVPVIDGFYTRFVERLVEADAAIPKMEISRETEPVGRDCPLCGNALLYRQGRFGRFIGCSNFPKCRHTEQILNKIGIPCPKDGGDLVEKRTRRGRVFFGCANYPDCDWTSWKRPLPEPCANCGGLLVQRNENTAECTQCGTRHEMSALPREPVPEPG
jgi:DNA topoisomerase-1